MKLTKDKTQLIVNDSLTESGRLPRIVFSPPYSVGDNPCFPPAALEYRLGNRSALDWIIDQYQLYTDKRTDITSDPNRPDDPEHIVRLVGQVVRASMETAAIVNSFMSRHKITISS